MKIIWLPTINKKCWLLVLAGLARVTMRAGLRANSVSDNTTYHSHLSLSLPPGCPSRAYGHHHLLLQPGVSDHQVVVDNDGVATGEDSRGGEGEVGELQQAHVRREQGQDLLQSLGPGPVIESASWERHWVVGWGGGREGGVVGIWLSGAPRLSWTSDYRLFLVKNYFFT